MQFKPRGHVLSAVLLLWCGVAGAQTGDLPGYLRDREGGIPSSEMGIYIQPHQLLIGPLYEHVWDHNLEYNPSTLGFGRDEDFRGRFRSSSAQIFLAYGLNDRLAVEFGISRTRSILSKSPIDTTATPARIEESGLGDVEGQIRMRITRESSRRPEIFGFLEAAAPTQRNKLLIGTFDWDFKPGIGAVRGFSWGTMTFRTTFEYTRDQTPVRESRHLDIGETSLEYLKRLSQALRMSLAMEGGENGAPDEWEFRSGLLWRMSRAVSLKLGNSFGLFSKSPDWTPQVGLMFSTIPR